MRLIDADELHKIISDWQESVMYKDWVQSAIANAPTIAPPPNTPLTLEELREMDGEPVWIIPMRGSGGFRTWMLVDAEYELCREAHGEMAVFENCGKTWLAYRRKPEEGIA